MPVYFARGCGTNFVKIGWAKTDVAKRIEVLQIGMPHTIEVLGVMDGDRATEVKLHARHSGSRFRGEWFRMTPWLAHDIAYDVLAKLVPDCRNCGCLDTGAGRESD